MRPYPGEDGDRNQGDGQLEPERAIERDGVDHRVLGARGQAGVVGRHQLIGRGTIDQLIVETELGDVDLAHRLARAAALDFTIRRTAEADIYRRGVDDDTTQAEFRTSNQLDARVPSP